MNICSLGMIIHSGQNNKNQFLFKVTEIQKELIYSYEVIVKRGIINDSINSDTQQPFIIDRIKRAIEKYYQEVTLIKGHKYPESFSSDCSIFRFKLTILDGDCEFGERQANWFMSLFE